MRISGVQISHLATITAILFLLSLWCMSPLAFYNSDTGLRYWQTRELIEQNRRSFAIAYPASDLDPELQFAPFYCAYSLVQGEVFFDITPFVPWLSSFLFAWLGRVGLTIVPVAAGILIALGSYKLAKLSRLSRPYLVFWCSVIATPVFFYTLQLWDHSPAVACAVWGVYGVALGISEKRWQPIFWAGVIVAIGLGQRPEMYMFALTLAVSLLLVDWPKWRSLLALAGGGLVGILPIWWAQYTWVGHPFGMAFATHLFGYGRPTPHTFICESPVSSLKIGRFLIYVGARDPQSFFAALLAIVSAFLLIFALRVTRLRKSWLLQSILFMSLLGYFLWGAILWNRALPGLITTFPLLGFSFAYLNRDRDHNPARPIYRFVFFTALLFLAGMIFIWPVYGGDHFGGRYLLPVYPLLVYLAFYAYDAYRNERPSQRSLQILGAGLLIIAVSLQILGVRLLIVKHQRDVVLQNAITDLPAEIILTNHPFLPTTYSAIDDKIFMYIDSESDFDILVPRFVDAGISRFGFISLQDLPLAVPERAGGIPLRQITPVLYELDQ